MPRAAIQERRRHRHFSLPHRIHSQPPQPDHLATHNVHLRFLLQHDRVADVLLRHQRVQVPAGRVQVPQASGEGGVRLRGRLLVRAGQVRVRVVPQVDQEHGQGVVRLHRHVRVPAGRVQVRQLPAQAQRLNAGHCFKLRVEG